jgi:hypothetical protein
MLTFKTQFPINQEVSVEAFLDCCREWIVGSPHTKLANSIPLSSYDGLYGGDSESAAFGYADTAGQTIGGVRWEKTDNEEIRWVTDVIGRKTDKSFLVSIQLNVDSELPVERMEQGKRPYIIKLLMKKFGGGSDGRLQVLDHPLELTEQDRELAVDIICAGTDSVMPVVYVSRSGSGEMAVAPHILATWVSGMAHVVVEPSRRFSSLITRSVYGENPYGGAIAIYWPDGIGKWLYLPNKWPDANALQSAISRKIRSSLLYQRIRRECTWSHLQEVVARKHIEELKSAGVGGVDEYVKHFDKEIAAKDEEISRLESEVTRLRFGRRSENRSNSQKTAFRLETSEQDLYQGEQLGIIIEALRAAEDAADEYSRRRHVIHQLIEANNNPGDRESILERLKAALRQYTTMTASIRAELEDIGFYIYDEGKHYKLLFLNDSRYPFVLPKSGSDFRGGLNSLSDLKRKLF